ncbi:MFS transporter [Frankia sp. AgPm24]|uniref:MFS transporter n=1 Tax=Frankia sp. AgPm24 TaxID=631128 RepID=UPI0020105BB7|nr:MFS transporter [Frankia sp. AgPm24]MCK9920662.1 MFS transporter [Frankia sp. AgPm24]
MTESSLAPHTAGSGSSGPDPAADVPAAGSQPPSAESRMTRRQQLALVLLLGSQFMLAIDFSILNVALPSIGSGVGLGDGDLQWIATAFALPSAGFTLLFARVADLSGRRRLFLIGLGLLVVASLLGGLAQSPVELLVARVGQGLAAAIAVPAALSLLVTTFPDGPVRRRALGLNGALLPAGFTVGALVGGLLTGYLSWRWAFLVNVPVALAILVATPRVIPLDRGTSGQRLDIPGALTVTAGLVAFVYGVSRGGEDGWSDPWVWVAIGLGLVLLVAFWRIERSSPHPLVSMDVLRMRHVGWGNAGGFGVFALGSSIVFIMTLYLQQVLGYSAVTTGLIFGVPGAAAFTAGMISPRLLTVIPSKPLLVFGLVLQGLCALALVFVGLDRGSLTLLLVASVVGFFGHACGIVGYLITATSGLRDDQQGLATGLTTLTQQVALTLGIPVLSAVANARTNTLRADGDHSPADAVLGGLHLALGVNAAVTAVVVVLVTVFLVRPGRPRRTDRADLADPGDLAQDRVAASSQGAALPAAAGSAPA